MKGCPGAKGTKRETIIGLWMDVLTPASTVKVLLPLRNNVAKCNVVFWSGSGDIKKNTSGKISTIQTRSSFMNNLY